MEPEVAFSYELTGQGWARCQIRIRDASCEVTASYLYDALGSLAAAVECCLRGWDEARAIFVEEPGEHRWLFTSVRQSRVRVQILEFPRWGKKWDEAGKVIFDAECDRASLGRAVASELSRLLALHGSVGYREMWVNHDFPVKRLRAIEGLLENGV